MKMQSILLVCAVLLAFITSVLSEPRDFYIGTLPCCPKITNKKKCRNAMSGCKWVPADVNVTGSTDQCIPRDSSRRLLDGDDTSLQTEADITTYLGPPYVCGQKPDQCERGSNDTDKYYRIAGQTCLITGDPHTYQWNGFRHDFQGIPQTGNRQFYYVAPCQGSNHVDMPFSILVTHNPVAGRDVATADYVTIELFDGNTNNDTNKYLLFLSTSIHSYTSKTEGISTLYDLNAAADLTNLRPNELNSIGNKFIFFYKDWGNRIDATLYIEPGCQVEIRMDAQGWKDGALNRYRAHAIYINPPKCYKCHICGLCGDFTSRPGKQQTCDGNRMRISAGYDVAAYDPHGWTWEKNYAKNNCSKYNANAIQVNVSDPCEPAIASAVVDECARARANLSECCDEIGGTFCDNLEEDCHLDACVRAKGNATKIARSVQKVFTNEVVLFCKIHENKQQFDVVDSYTMSAENQSENNGMYGLLSLVLMGVVVLFCMVRYYMTSKNKQYDDAVVTLKEVDIGYGSTLSA